MDLALGARNGKRYPVMADSVRPGSALHRRLTIKYEDVLLQESLGPEIFAGLGLPPGEELDVDVMLCSQGVEGR